MQELENEAGTAETYDTGRNLALIVGTTGAILLVVHQLFNIQLFGIVLLDSRYLALLAAIFLSLSFLVFNRRGERLGPVAFYDWSLATLALASGFYLAWVAKLNLSEGWEYAAPQTAQWVAYVFFALVLEATRRAGGKVLFAIVALFSLYPTFAGHVPDPFSGFQSTFSEAVAYHVYSSESIFGIPMRAFGGVVIGFIIFGAVLQHTGGGQFFNDLALALVGRYRGGAAKVSIFASGFMGSMSGSVISNILTTGAVSIPAMRRTGFSAKTAAATEACASTGGVLMPPIMGATAFVMASFLSMPYVEIAIAAAIPSLLFYFGLFVQIDAYSARLGLRGMSGPDLPRLNATLREGWPYVLVFAVLIFMMIVLRQETAAPFYATVLLLIVNQIFPRHRLTVAGLIDVLKRVGTGLTELTAIILGVGLIVGSFSATGLAGTLVNELLALAGDNVFILLIAGAMTAFVFGMGMTVTACYIFLAVVLAPALEAGGLNILAVHLFILYWGMVSYITPPVALGAYAAATMAGTSAMKAGLEAMRLGGVIYIAPFFFVLNPALVAQSPAIEVFIAVTCALLGLALICMALQGYVIFLGPLSGAGEFPLRFVLFVAGFLIALPEMDYVGVPFGPSLIAGILLAFPPLFVALRRRSTDLAGENT
ncbi:TRAP transporter permease [Ruegeria profundi]|uniref:TRAP transporter permease n=1 Tax=Ruegeria profundi TaxID=1685378 RepID=UPI001CD3478D|nr:TRAP transporter fused permease subunit [Ruegeria profundi]MCA0928403.1 TRAP transporter fused permease subunit [Ruegeria profundi]